MSAAPPETAEKRAQAEAWVAEFIEGWRAPVSADAFADHFERVLAPDVRLVQPQLPTMSGHQAFREQFCRPLFALIPDMHAVVHRWAVDDDLALIEFTLHGTLGGRPVSWDAVDRISLRDGICTERVSYFDPAPLLAAVATRPRAWRRAAPLQFRTLVSQLRRRRSR